MKCLCQIFIFLGNNRSIFVCMSPLRGNIDHDMSTCHEPIVLHVPLLHVNMLTYWLMLAQSFLRYFACAMTAKGLREMKD